MGVGSQGPELGVLVAVETRRTQAQASGRVRRRTDRWMDGQVDGRVDGKMGGWLDRWTDVGTSTHHEARFYVRMSITLSSDTLPASVQVHRVSSSFLLPCRNSFP